MVWSRCYVSRPREISSSLYNLRVATRHNRGALSWYNLSATYHSNDSGPPQGLYLCRIILRYRCARTELITPNLICPSTHQLLRSSGGDSGPDMSFDMSASLERLFSLARVSLSGASKLPFSSGCSEGDYTSSLIKRNNMSRYQMHIVKKNVFFWNPYLIS
ncbi:hypothetical protein Tco_0479074 [Tanacetum coccineum]